MRYVYARFFPKKEWEISPTFLFQAFNSELTWKNRKSTRGIFERLQRGALDSTVDLSQSVLCNRPSNYYFWSVAWSSVESLQGKRPGSCLTCRHRWAGASKLSAGAEREGNEAGGNDGGECRGHGGKKQETNGGRGWWTRKGHWHVVESSRFIGRVHSPHG